jgi:hypothetical protein
MIRRRAALLALPGLALATGRCAPPPSLGGEEGGIGGTGLRAGLGEEEREGGIGGTGVFGTVTALGSVVVNGLRLGTTPATRFENAAAQGGPPVLPGETVAAEAHRRGVAGALVATRIAVFHPVTGPLQTTADGGRAVLGTRLLLAADAPLRDPSGRPLPPDALRDGVVVAASGIWRGDAVETTALRVLPESAPPTRVVLRGQVRAAAGEAPRIGGTPLRFRGRAEPPANSFVTVRGRPGPLGVLLVEALATEPLAVFSGRLAALSVEGVMAPNPGAPGYHLSGFGLPMDPASAVAPRPGQRQLFLGRYADGFRVTASIPLPAEAAVRAGVLTSSEAAATIRRWLATR